MKRIILFLFIVALWGCSDNSTDSGGNNDEAYSNEDVCKEGLKKTLVNGNCTAELVCQNNSWVSTSYICYEKCDKVGAEKETVVGQCITNYVCKLGQNYAIWVPVDSSCTDISVKNSSSSVIGSSSSIVNSISSVVNTSSAVVSSSSFVMNSNSSVAIQTVHYDCSVYKCVTTEFLNQESLASGKYGEYLDTRDNQVYRTVQIGSQIWMAQNLNYEQEGKCFDVCAKYGRFYSWKYAKDVCPSGWHLPDTTEWDILVATAGGTSLAGKQLSTRGWDGWEGTDAFLFSALPAGREMFYYNDLNGSGYVYDLENKGAYFWSSVMADEPAIYHVDGTVRYINFTKDSVIVSSTYPTFGFSVRCIQDGNLVDERDGEIYRTVTIGSQTWMAENLRFEYKVGRDSYGTSAEGGRYGRLYTWAAAMDSAGIYSENGRGCSIYIDKNTPCDPVYPVRGICPEGWHLPDTTEWLILYDAVGHNPYALQAAGFEKATNASGFSAITGKPVLGRFWGADFWSSSWSIEGESYTHWNGSYSWWLRADSAYFKQEDVRVAYIEGVKTGASYVRCVKD